MIPFFKRFFKAFFNDELSFIRWTRGLVQTMGVSGAVYADQIAQTIGAPSAVKIIRWVAVGCAFVAGAITAGEKNPKPEEMPK